jgi:rod shape determining protein RodA
MRGKINQQGQPKSLLANLDWVTAGIYAILLLFGWLNIYSSEFGESTQRILDTSTSHGKQLLWIGASMLTIIFIFLLDYRLYHTISYLFYGFALLLLLVTLVMGKVVAGAKGWLVIGGFQLQTSEIAKFATAMALARYLSTHGVDISRWRDKLIGFAFILVPCAMVLLQNDTGSAMVFLALTFVLYRQGLEAYFITIPVYVGVLSLMVLLFDKMPVLITVGVLGFLIFWLVRRQLKLVGLLLLFLCTSVGIVFGVDFAVNKVLKEYQRERIYVTIGKIEDPKGVGYNVRQSLIAIGSGGVTGKGFLKGTQTKYNFVPEQSTDFIFCTIGEEYGFIGSAFLMLLYLYLLYRIMLIAERQKFLYNQCYAYGVFAILFFHFTINIGMTLGILPVIGIPLPFISYGGSSLLAFTALLFVLLKLDAANKEY